MPTSTAGRVWNPKALLDVHPDKPCFTCVGITKKGARCRQSFFSGADLSRATQILNDMALHRPSSRSARKDLKELAGLTLCERWHRKPGYSQVDDMKWKWLDIMDTYCAENPIPVAQPEIRRPRRTVPARLRIDSEENDTPSTTARQTPEPLTTIPPLWPWLQEDAANGRPASRSTSRSASRSTSETVTTSHTSTTSRTVSASGSVTTQHTVTTTRTVTTTPARTSDSNLQLLSPPTSPQLSPVREGRRAVRTPSIRFLSPVSPVSPISPISPISPPQSRASSPSPSPLVRRKPITENCGICYEAIDSLDDAVWCRAQCGQNVHTECFDTWRSETERTQRGRMDDGGLGVKCVYCRSQWID